MKRAALRYLLFGCYGLLLEVFFTAAWALFNGDWSLRGHTSPWMMLDYGLLGIVLMPAAERLKAAGFPLPVRALVYMVGIYAVEYVSGMLFDLAGLKIWDYSCLPLNVHGYITLAYAPFWYGLGLMLEWWYWHVDAVAGALLGARE